MRKADFIYMLISLTLLASCGRDKRLDDIESYIQEFPDSALTTIQRIPPSSLKGKGEKARYALLYNMALDKNYIDITSDSTIINAVNWYERGRDRHRLMLSYYYKGKVEFNSHNYPVSIAYATRALDLSSKTEDRHYEGLIHWLIADIYYANHNHQKALAHYDKADESFQSAHMDRHSLFSKCESAKMYIALQDYQKCDSVLSVLNNFANGEDTALISTCHSLAIQSKSFQYKDREAIQEYELWKALPIRVNSFTVYGQVAASYARLGNKAMAENCLELASKSASGEQSELLSSYYGEVLYEEGQYRQAIDSLEKGYNYQNKVASAQFSNSIDSSLSELYKSEARMKEQSMKSKLALVVSFFAFLCLGFLFFHLARKKEYREKLNSAEADISFITQMNRDSLQNFAKFMQIRQGMLDDVIAGYDEEKHSFKKGVAYDVIEDKIENLKAGGDGFKKLIKDLNSCFGDIMKKLREHYPDISRQDYRILAYYFSGFSQETVSVLSGIPVQKLYNLKRVWVKKFNSLDSPDKELFLLRLNPTKKV